MRLWEVSIYDGRGNLLRRLPYPAMRHRDAIAFARSLRGTIVGAEACHAAEV
jgi:hypothetical protein